MTAPGSLVIRFPLPHRALARRRPRSMRLQQRCAWQFRTDVALAVRDEPALSLMFKNDVIADVTIGTREARRVGPLWVPYSRADMLEIASIAAAAISDAAGITPDRIIVGDVQRSSNWGPSILVRLRSASSTGEV